VDPAARDGSVDLCWVNEPIPSPRARRSEVRESSRGYALRNNACNARILWAVASRLRRSSHFARFDDRIEFYAIDGIPFANGFTSK
jgi:hypothetical protein